MSYNFSSATRELIGKARLVALDLGYNYISTLHFFLADCELNGKHSIKKFVFRDDLSYTTFYNKQKSPEPTIFFEEGLPLLKEAEITIRNAKIEKRCYRDKFIEPYHILFAAIKYKKSVLFSIFKAKDEIAPRLENYYLAKGAIKQENIKKGFWYKFGKAGLFTKND